MDSGNTFSLITCCRYWPPVREVCLNYEVVDFQPWTLTTPDLGSVAYCCVAYLLDPPRPLLLQSDAPPTPRLCFACLRHRHHRIIRPPGSPLSLSQHTENPYPSLLSPITARGLLLIPSFAPATLVGFLSPPLPRCCRNIFQRGLQLFLLIHMPPPRLAQLPISLVSRILCTDLKYWPKVRPLRYRRFPLVDILLQRFSSCLAPPTLYIYWLVFKYKILY